VEDILDHAERLEREYNWLGAAESYEKALKLLPDDDLKVGEGYERLGYALYRLAFQAETYEDFRDRLRQSSAIYANATEFYERPKESVKTAKTLRCKAMTAYIGYWLASEAKEKKRLIDECWRLACDALRAFKEAGEGLEYGKTFNQFSRSADLSFCLEWDGKSREGLIREAAEHGEKAIEYLSTIAKNDEELARAYVKTADYIYALGYTFLSREDQERQFEKAREYWQKAKALSEEATTLEALSVLEGLMLEFGTGTSEALTFYQRALEYGKKTADNFIVGFAFELLAFHTNHKAWSVTEDPDEKAKISERALQYAAEAKQRYSRISFVSPGGFGLIWVEAPDAEYYCELARAQTDSSRRHHLARKAVDAAPELLERAESSGYPDAVQYAHHVMGKIFTFLARIETDSSSKNKLLEEALHHRNEVFRILEQVAPSMYWERGIALEGISAVKSQLANLASDSEAKKKMLLEAVENEQESLKLLAKGMISPERENSMIAILGYAQYQCGVLLNRVYEFTRNKEHLTKATQAFEEAAAYYGKFELMGRVAECYWKTAHAYDCSGEHIKAAEDFTLASDNYKKAAERTPSLRTLYQDQAVYMQAWSEIEKARRHLERREYDQAKECFEKAAAFHASLKRWSYLEPNYSAWAQVEDAEQLSGKEHCEEAMKAFESASKLFSDAKKSVQAQLSKIEDDDEKQMATGIIRVSNLRKEYCDARIVLEEAKILDKKGDHLGSSRKYGAAAEILEKVCQALESEQGKKEFRPMIDLSRAWQKMMLGDAKASPESYLEASVLFEQASRESSSEVDGLLALGHSRFCKALEAGTRFADTGNAAMQTVAMQNLGIAAKYYVKAGFPSASEYAKATGLLFDAYVQMDTAKEEKDPEKKTKRYLIAEKVLQASAGSFMKAEHPEKREQVLRLLEKVREEKEMALSIAEVLHAPSIVSTTTSFSAPTSNSEEAVGSERFDQADVQAILTVKQKELKVGESLSIQLELVNAGKSPALLIKVTEVIPEGFDVAEKPENYRMEDSYIDMKGKRLDPLRTEEVKLVLKPRVQGVFPLKLKVLYLDENGKYKTHEPEPVTITVKELGLKGWLKGER
jgi:tetratricopeptide (TPR) repeat protein